MSQLNNEEEKENMKETEEIVDTEETKEIQKEDNKEIKKEKKVKDKKEKKKLKTKTKIIIFLVAFTIVCIGVTAALILVHKNNNNVIIEEKTEEEKKKEIYEAADDGFGIKSLTERYNGNDLKIETVKDGVGTRTPSSEYDKNTHKVNIQYVQIDGLKDGAIESKINKEIKDKAFSMYTNDELSNQNIDYVDIDSYEGSGANFGNVLSITIHKSVCYNKTNGEYKSDYSREYLNFDLTTGNQIKFEEMFTNKTSLKNVLIPVINKSLRSEAMYGDDGGERIDFSKIDLSEIEEKSYKILNSIMNDIDNVKFGFDFRFIDLNVKDYSLEIDMSTIYRNIAIYKRFLTKESIFDGSYTNELKNVYVFSSFYTGDGNANQGYRILEDIEDNLRVEAIVSCDKEVYEEKEGKQLYDQFVEMLTDKIAELKIEAKNNPNKQILYVAEYWISGHENENLTKRGIKNIITNTNGLAKIYRMDKKYYDDTFFEKMAQEQRGTNYTGGLTNGIYFYNVEENDKNVEVEEIRQEYETFDLYTNRTEEQLKGIANIKDYIETLKLERDRIKKSEDVSYLDYLDIRQIEYYQDFFNLKDDEEANELKKEAQAIIDETKEIIAERKKKKEEEQLKKQEEQKKEQEQKQNSIINQTTNTVDSNTIIVNNNTNP